MNADPDGERETAKERKEQKGTNKHGISRAVSLGLSVSRSRLRYFALSRSQSG
jgi:hypothetical protein